jgi:hypothetical protein
LARDGNAGKLQLGHCVEVRHRKPNNNCNVRLVERMHAAAPDFTKARNLVQLLVGTKTSDADSTRRSVFGRDLEISVGDPLL